MSLILPRTSQTTRQSNLPATPATNPGATVTADATIHTKGAYAELIAATTYDSYGFWLQIQATAASGADTSMLLDIAIGAAGSEVVILPNFLCGFRPATSTAFNIFFIPLFIPKGSRVAARIQALISADTVAVAVFLNGGSSGPRSGIFTSCDAYGVDLTDSGGTAHTPGNSGAESTDANVGDVLTRNYGAVMLGLGFSGTVMTSVVYHWELTDGTNTLGEWSSVSTTTEFLLGPVPPAPLEMELPAGMQLQIQAEGSGTSIAHDVAFYCFY